MTARYLTIGGATVEVTDDGSKATCRGCDRKRDDRRDSPYLFRVRLWAQDHAEKCRAMPRLDAREQQ